MHLSYHQIRSRAARQVLWLLLPALLLVQWVGLAHRTAHANWSQTSAAAVSSTATAHAALPSFFGDIGEGKRHSCAEFDAATMAECLHHTPIIPLVIASNAVLNPDTVATAWDALTELHFSSRAPPTV